MQLSDCQITEVEAVYLCLFESSLSSDFKIALVKHIYETNPYMYVYLHWLVFSLATALRQTHHALTSPL